MLRVMMGSMAEMHAPLHNINMISNTHKDGDNNGRDVKVSTSKSGSTTLFDLWENGVELYDSAAYVITNNNAVAI